MIFNLYEAVLRGSGLVSTALDTSDSTLNVSFVNTPGSAFTIQGSDQDDTYVQIGLGLSVEINYKWDMQLDLDQKIASNGTGTILSGGLTYKF